MEVSKLQADGEQTGRNGHRCPENTLTVGLCLMPLGRWAVVSRQTVGPSVPTGTRHTGCKTGLARVRVDAPARAALSSETFKWEPPWWS